VAEAIALSDLVPMDLFAASEPLKIDLVYADKNHHENIFGVALYHHNARLTLRKELSKLVVATARYLHDRCGEVLILKDGLRPVEAQAAMAQTKIVKDNPHWLQEPGRLLSPPGAGAHPRGMAIDVAVQDSAGKPIDMGTVFDTMTAQSARDYDGFPASILHNRRRLEEAFAEQAQRLGLPLLALSSEWWDFRFPKKYYEDCSPFSDKDLPPPLSLLLPATDHTGEWQSRFDKTAKEVLNSL